MALGDIFKLTLVSSIGGTVMNNVFHYRQTFGVTGGETLAGEFINEVFGDIRNIVSTEVEFQRVEWINYNDLGDFGEDTEIQGVNGTRVGQALPRFNAWGFKYNRDTRATRNGAKRFGSVSETDQSYGQPDGDIGPLLDACAGSLQEFLNLGGIEIWRPVIARLTEDGSAVVLTNDVASVSFSRLTTQNSRKTWS